MEKFCITFLEKSDISESSSVLSEALLNVHLHIAVFQGHGEKFKVSKDLVYSYVKAIIVTQIHSLQVYLGDDLVQKFDYKLTT
jgi:hypothetical protein